MPNYYNNKQIPSWKFCVVEMALVLSTFQLFKSFLRPLVLCHFTMLQLYIKNKFDETGVCAYGDDITRTDTKLDGEAKIWMQRPIT